MALRNYRQYSDAKISFAAAGDHDLHIVLGCNGLGKTNLMNAIEWCLYGTEFHLSAKSSGLEMVHQPPADRPREFALGVQVDISWQSDRNDCYGFFRREFDKRNVFTFVSNANADSRVYEDSDARRWVERFIPEGMKDKYFFDGEQLWDYFNENDPGTIKNALFKLSRVKVLDTVVSHLDDLRTDLQRKSGGKVSSKIEELTQRKGALKKDSERAQKDLERALDEEKMAHEKIDAVDKELRRTERTRALDSTRQNLEQQKSELQRSLAEKTRARTLLVTRMYSTSACLEPLVAFQRLLVEKEERRELPPPILPRVIRDVLEKDHVCLCGEPIKDGDEHYRRLSELLNLVENTSRFSEVITTGIREGVPILLSGLHKDLSRLKELLNDIGNINNQLTSVQKQLGDIHDELLGLDVQHIEELERSRESLFNHYRFSTSQAEQQKNLLSNITEELKAVDADLDKAMQQANVAQAVTQRISVVDRALAVCENAKQERIGLIRSAVEHDFQDRFKDLMWKTDSFSSVDLDIDYGVHVRDDRGRDALGTMSKAEIQAVAIAFTLALHTVSGYEGPLVIDTPFARTEGKIRRNMAEMLLELSASKQVVLLVTPAEYTDEVEATFRNKASTFSELVLGEYEKQTRVSTGS